MKIWKDGEKSRSLCPQCERRTAIVYRRRDVSQDVPKVVARNVLVGVCTECDSTAVIPNQSIPRIREAVRRPTATLNARIPAHLEDVLHMLVDRVASGRDGGRSAVLRYLLREFGHDVHYAREVKRCLDDEITFGPAESDVSIRVPAYVLADVDEMCDLVGIAGRSEVVRGVLACALHDVIEGGDADFTVSMQRAISAAG